MYFTRSYNYCDPDFLKYVARHPKEFNKDKLGFIEAMNIELGTNVLSASETHDWLRHRTLLNEAFTDSSVACAWGMTIQR
jgi:cytochrome P450